jgi:hypothetical protein
MSIRRGVGHRMVSNDFTSKFKGAREEEKKACDEEHVVTILIRVRNMIY